MNIRLPTFGAAVLILAGCASTAPQYGSRDRGYYDPGYGAVPARCYDCGVVTRIDRVPSGRSAPSATGAVLGGIVGAIAGRQISDRTGGSKGNQNVSTAAGAVAGAVAGNAIQKRTSGDSYDLHVRMDDGRTVVIHQRDLDGIRENAYVRVVDGRVVSR